MRPIPRQHAVTCLLALACVGLSVIRLDVPPIWFDEGWALSVARNWIECGHYGQLMAGQRVPPTTLSTGMPAVAPIALSFRLFGIGVWQGRLPGVLFATGALVLLWHLAASLYQPRVGWGAVVICLLLPPLVHVHPVLMGRQALGEMPALLYLLSGYLLLLRSWGASWWLVPACLLWALALRTKPQVVPFFAVSMIVPGLYYAWYRKWRTASWLAAGALVALGLSAALGLAQRPLVGHYHVASPINDAYQLLRDPASLFTYALVLDPAVRKQALASVGLFGLPTLLGLCALPGQWVMHRRGPADCPKGIGRLVIWCFASSWFLWFLLLSIGWPRYLFPALFMGSIPLAAFLYEHTDGLSPSLVVHKAARSLRHWPPMLSGALHLGITLGFAISLALNLVVLHSLLGAPSDNAAHDLVKYIEQRAQPGELIETYDSELFYLLDRPYHYPSDAVQLQLNQRTFLRRADVIVDYDPLAADPDYLVVGPFSRGWGLYDEVLQSGAFRLLHTEGPYDLYERVR